MDKIWDRNPSKSEIVAVMKKQMTTQDRQKSNAKRKINIFFLKGQSELHLVISY